MAETALLTRETLTTYPSMQTRLSSCEADLTAWNTLASEENRLPEDAEQINMRLQLSALALGPETDVDGIAFAERIATYHAVVNRNNPIRAVFNHAFEAAMGKLASHPTVQAELLYRNHTANNGWQPLGDREEQLLKSWLDGVKYLSERETTEEIERAAGFAGSLLSQRLKRRDHIRRQGSGFAQSYSSVFPEVPRPRSED